MSCDFNKGHIAIDPYFAYIALLLFSAYLHHSFFNQQRIRVGQVKMFACSNLASWRTLQKELQSKNKKMPYIIHRVGIKSSLQKVYDALSTVAGISGWWTENTSGMSQVGEIIVARFLSLEGKEIGTINIEVVALQPINKVHWRFTAGPKEWIGTDVIFDIHQEEDYTVVLFGHKNWKEQVEFTAHCSMKWGTFMLSLKEFVETGKGRPSPHDIKVDNWN